MRGRIVAVATVAACLVASAPAGAQDWQQVPHWPGKMTATHSFESPDIPTGSWNTFGSIPYWTATTHCGIEVQDNVAGAPAVGGQFVELNSNCPSGIRYTIDIGNRHRYIEGRFAFSPRPYTQAQDNVMQVLFDGRVLAVRNTATNAYAQTIGPAVGGATTKWSWYSFRVGDVPAGVHTLTFRSVGTNPSGGGVGTYLDHVTLEREVACDEYGGTWCQQGGALPGYEIP